MQQRAYTNLNLQVKKGLHRKWWLIGKIGATSIH